jgi:hypothetical protein
MHPDVE